MYCYIVNGLDILFILLCIFERQHSTDRQTKISRSVGYINIDIELFAFHLFYQSCLHKYLNICKSWSNSSTPPSINIDLTTISSPATNKKISLDLPTERRSEHAECNETTNISEKVTQNGVHGQQSYIYWYKSATDSHTNWHFQFDLLRLLALSSRKN